MNQDSLQKFRVFFKNALNEEQQKAVAPLEGVFLVRAGAGSGKTRVITARILHLLLEHAISPAAIVALTFTNKAAQEMRERVTRALPSDITPPTVNTFHSYGLQLLKRFGSLIGWPTFSIMDSDDRDKLLQTIIKRQNLNKRITASQVASLISRYKNSITSCAKKPTTAFPEDAFYQHIFQAYEHERRAAHCLDFDDLLLETLRLLETQPECKSQLQKAIKHILVDEYQDTNRLQHAIIQQLSFTNTNEYALTSLCVVGDENQSIYSWRGATVDNMTGFSRSFPQVTTIAIKQNYRSVQPVLQTANAIIRNNKSHAPHEIWSERNAHGRVRFIACTNAYQEGDIIAGCAKYFQRKNALSELTILYRSHFQSRSIEEALIRNSVPYKIIGGTQFYDRQEIKDLLAYLKLAVNPFDRISFTRCINVPSRTLGDAFVEQYIQIWNDSSDWSFSDVAKHLIDSKTLTPKKQQALEKFCAIIHSLQAATTAHEAIGELISRTAFILYLAENYEHAEAQERTANVHELTNAIHALAERGSKTIADFLDEVALVQEHINKESNSLDYVRLMTLHSAKGLEFNTVILPGIEEGIIPSAHAWNAESIEEERRLLYVGITRAEERLIFTRTLARFMYGSTRNQIASRFVTELPKAHVEYIDATNRYLSSVTQEFSSWLQLTERSSHLSQKNTEAQRSTVEAKAATPAQQTVWRTLQKVKHPTFGVGVIRAIETRHPTPYLTIEFNSGIKKIAAEYVQPA